MVSKQAAASVPRSASTRRRAAQVALGALLLPLLGLAGWHVIQFARTIAGRITYPGDLEWMEGGQLYHAYRILHGLPLYGPCADGFIPFPYPPVHAAVVAGAGALFGLDYLVARLVSVGAFTLCCVVLCREVARTSRTATQRWVTMALAAGSLAASYPYTGTWYDLIRVDSVFVALLFGGAALSLPPGKGGAVRRRLSGPRIAVCAVVLCGALFSKQTAVLFIPWIVLFAIWRDWRSGLWLAGATGALSVTLLGLFQWSSDGYFWTFMVTVMSRHELIYAQTLTNALRLLMIHPYLPLVALVALWLWRKGKLRLRVIFWAGMLASAMVASLATSTKTAAAANNIMTAALLSGPVALMVVLDMLAAMPRRHFARWLSTAGLAIVAILLLREQIYRPDMFVPPAGHWKRVRAFNELVASLDGGVLIPAHPFIAIRNGHRNVQIHEQGHVDVLGAGLESLDIVDCVAQLDARWLILNAPSELYLKALLTTHYQLRAEIPKAARAAVISYTRPYWLYERRDNSLSLRRRLHRRSLFDFESGGYVDWEQRGDAFSAGPSEARTKVQQPIDGHQGHLLVNSHDPRIGDPSIGRLRSPEFLIDRTHLGFRVGGGKSPLLHVALEVDGRIVRGAQGPGQDIEMLVPKVWDVTNLRSKRARFIIVDEARGGWGHILVDAIELFDLPPR
jgi:hypothetical protein